MKQYYIDSNIKDVINWASNISKNIFNEDLVQTIAQVFKERSRAKLEASQQFFDTDISRYVNSIVARKVNDTTYRIYAGYGGDQDLKDDMYYLEFGTGITGAWSPHPQATLIGWGYDINNHGYKGWVFDRDDDEQLITKTDTIYHNENGDEVAVRTKGIVAIRYFYNTMLEFDEIVAEALGRLK